MPFLKGLRAQHHSVVLSRHPFFLQTEGSCVSSILFEVGVLFQPPLEKEVNPISLPFVL